MGPPDGKWALVALGSYGRRELCPTSDLDLLVLHERHVAVDEACKRLSYVLWDAGFDLGLTPATPKESFRLSAASFDTRTSFFDARLIEGDEAAFREWSAKIIADGRKSGSRILAALGESCTTRWEKHGDAGAELEPNLKEGKGGLRDLAAIGWISKIFEQIPPPQGLEEALDFLLRVRMALHRVIGRRTDTLVMQHHLPVARSLGIDENKLMRTLYGLCRRVSENLESLVHPDFELAEAANRFSSHFLAAGKPAWNDDARRALTEILRAGPNGRRAFRKIEIDGSLAVALPSWEHVICLPQRNIYHRWAVDVHSFEVAATLGSLEKGSDGLISQVAADASADLDLLLLAGLLHDIGKGLPGDHSQSGEVLALQCAEAFGLPGEPVADIAWLVRNHLLLAETAVRRDLGDETLIVELAEKIGAPRRLRMLFLLTVADSMATGPAAWTDWKAHLVSHLFVEINHLLEKGELVGGGASQRAASHRQRLQRDLSGHDPDAVARHLAEMPRAWLLSAGPESLARQSRLMLEFPSGGDLEVYPVRRQESATWEVTVVARDRPGLFSKVAGGLALHGLNVLSAQIFTREDGLAIEIFRVEAISQEHQRFRHVARDALGALAGELSLEDSLAVKRRDYSARPQKGKGEPPSVVVDNRASDFYSVVEVHAPDRIGLLYSITDEMARLGLDIHLAKVATYAHDVVDVFYVRDVEGQKVTEPAAIEELRRAIVSRLAREAAAS